MIIQVFSPILIVRGLCILGSGEMHRPGALSNNRGIAFCAFVIYAHSITAAASCMHKRNHLIDVRIFRTMHCNAKRGLALTYPLSVCPSVCDVFRSSAHGRCKQTPIKTLEKRDSRRIQGLLYFWSTPYYVTNE